MEKVIRFVLVIVCAATVCVSCRRGMGFNENERHYTLDDFVEVSPEPVARWELENMSLSMPVEFRVLGEARRFFGRGWEAHGWLPFEL